jgi:protein-arginine kinase activator protein McsA
MKVVVKFVRANGLYAPGDITQLDVEEAKKEESRHNVVLLQEVDGNTMSGDFTNAGPEQSKEDKLTCPICGKTFKSEKALKLHKTKVHAAQ